MTSKNVQKIRHTCRVECIDRRVLQRHDGYAVRMHLNRSLLIHAGQVFCRLCSLLKACAFFLLGPPIMLSRCPCSSVKSHPVDK